MLPEPEFVTNLRLAIPYLIEVAKYTLFTAATAIIATNLLLGVMPWQLLRPKGKR
jgi:hypothetical protein